MDSKTIKGLLIAGGVLLASTIGCCGIFGFFGAVSDKNKPTVESQTVETPKPFISQTPTPMPAPETFAELKQKANNALALEKEEYSQDDIKVFTDTSEKLKAIPKTEKDYKEAQSLSKKLYDRVIRLAAERLLLGDKPQSGYNGKVSEVDQYLSKTLNDYDDSEYVEWTPVKKIEIKGEPYWAVGLKLRAKNAFGAKILKDVVFLIRQGQVVKTMGL
jgi:hypothetical protein